MPPNIAKRMRLALRTGSPCVPSDQVAPGRDTELAARNALLQPKARQPVQALQLIARDHPPRGDALRAFPLSLRNVEDLLFERGLDISYETVRFWWNRFGPLSLQTFADSAFRGCGAFGMAMASRRGLRENQRRDALPVAGRESGAQSSKATVLQALNHPHGD
jgi:hypothetical protein